MPLTGALPDIETCQKFTGETKAKQGGGHYEKQIVLPKNGVNQANTEGDIIMKNEMPSLLLDEKNMPYKVTSRYTAKFLADH